MADENKLNTMEGVYLERVNQGGAAEDAGLKKGDIVTHVNGVKVTSSPELQEQVALFRPGQKIKVIFLRDGKESEIELKLN